MGVSLSELKKAAPDGLFFSGSLIEFQKLIEPAEPEENERLIEDPTLRLIGVVLRGQQRNGSLARHRSREQ